MRNIQVKTFLAILFYRIVLDMSFIIYIIPYTSYERITYDPDIVKMVESYLVLFVMLYWLPVSSRKLSTVVIYIFFLLDYMPFQSYYAIGNQVRWSFYMGTFFWSLVLFLNSIPLKFRLSNQNKKIDKFLILIIIFISVVTIGLVLNLYGFSLNLDMSIVYDIRKIYLQKSFFFSGYMVNWTAKVFIPFLVLIALFGKKKTECFLLLIFALLAGFYLFSVTGNKVYLFSIIMAVLFAFLLKRVNYFKSFATVFTFFSLCCLLSLWLIDDIWLGSLFLRRMLFIPAKLSFCYLDFFNDQSIYLSHSILSFFSDYPYDLDPPYLIGKVYFDKPEMSANNGIMVDGFMNFGIIGLVIWAAILVFMLKIAENFSEGKDIRIFWAIFIVSFFNLIDGALFTSLLTHGILLTFLVVFLYPSKKMVI